MQSLFYREIVITVLSALSATVAPYTIILTWPITQTTVFPCQCFTFILSMDMIEGNHTMGHINVYFLIAGVKLCEIDKVVLQSHEYFEVERLITLEIPSA